MKEIFSISTTDNKKIEVSTFPFGKINISIIKKHCRFVNDFFKDFSKKSKKFLKNGHF